VELLSSQLKTENYENQCHRWNFNTNPSERQAKTMHISDYTAIRISQALIFSFILDAYDGTSLKPVIGTNM
jgi:hypothetical protein